MPKKGGGFEQRGMRQGPKEKGRFNEEGIRQELGNMLKTLKDFHTFAMESGQPAFDPDDVTKKIEKFQREHGFHDVRHVYGTLFEAGVPLRALEEFAQSLETQGFIPKVQVLSAEYIRQSTFGINSLIYEADLDFKEDFSGREWLASVVTEQFKRKNMDLSNMHRVQNIAREVGRSYGSEAEKLMRLMYVCSEDELRSRRTRYPDVTEQADLLSRSRRAEARTEGVREQNAFFENMRSFLSVYADITSKVISNASPQHTEEIGTKARHVLSRFLQSEALRTAHLDVGEKPPNPFVVFSEMLRDNAELNPWVVTDGSETPFDVRKFHLLITGEVPRGLIADAAYAINNHDEAFLSQELVELPADIRAYKAQEREAGRPGSLSKDLARKLWGAVARIQKVQRSLDKVDIPRDPQEQLQIVEEFVRAIHGGISPFAATLRLVDAQKLVHYHGLRQQFEALLARVPSLDDPTRSLGEKEIQVLASSVQAVIEDPDVHLDVPLLGIQEGYSLRTLLTVRAYEWFDDDVLTKGPYAHSEKKTSPEKPLIPPRDVWNVPQVELSKLRMNFNSAAGARWLWPRTWIHEACRILRGLPDSYENIRQFGMREAKRHYNMGDRHEVIFYASVTDAMSNIVDVLFPDIAEGDHFLASPQEYDGVTDPFIGKGARIEVVYNNNRAEARPRNPEELFQKIVNAIEGRKKEPRAVLLSSKTRFGDAIGVTEDDFPPDGGMKDSEGTEVPMGPKTPNSYGLRYVVQKLKDKYPRIPVIVDSSQSLGRNDRGEDLSRTPCDIFLTSGGKALGLENVGMIAIRKPGWEEKVTAEEESSKGKGGKKQGQKTVVRYPKRHWMDRLDSAMWENPQAKLTPGKGTVDTARIAAFATALRLLSLKIDTWKQADPQDSRSQRERIADHMADLTEYAIQNVGAYSILFLERLQEENLPFPALEIREQMQNPEVMRQFGCHTVDPVHRKKVDEDGIITVTFPNLGRVVGRRNKAVDQATSEESSQRVFEFLSSGGVTSESEVTEQAVSKMPSQYVVRDVYLRNALENLGFSVEQCKQGGNAYRISFHYYHEKKDIDLLFQTIAGLHADFLRGEIVRLYREAENAKDESKRIRTFEDLKRMTPNVQDVTWMDDLG